MFTKKNMIAAALSLGLVGQVCEAQSLGAISFEIEGWAYVPVYSVDTDVEAIVALRVVASASPINALWCKQMPDGSWAAKAWESSFPEEVASYVIDYVGGSADDESLDELAYLWPIDLDITVLVGFMQSPISPVPFGDGIYIGDDMEPIVYSLPELLEPLSQTGYPAISNISGSPINTGSFSGVGIDPEPEPGDPCVTAPDLLGVLKTAFSASMTDGDLVDQVFGYEYGLANEGCGGGCRDRIRRTAITPWADTCGTWEPTGFEQRATECVYSWERSVSGTRSRTFTRTYTDCSTATCTQTNTRSGTQSRNTITIRPIGTECSGVGTPPPAGTACNCRNSFWSDADTCTETGWAPPCVWPTTGGGSGG